MPHNLGILRQLQEDIARRVSLRNELPPLSQIHTVAAADISCGRFSRTGYASVVVLSYPDGNVLLKTHAIGELEFPYIPGYLAFREWPLIKQCLDQVSQIIDVLICDGQGIAHPRRAGLAAHIGVLSGFITIGCAKSHLVGDFQEPGMDKGAFSDLVLQEEKVGEVLRSKKNVKPLFISPGHRIDFSHATALILSLCGKYRQPEPIREAHRYVNIIRQSGGLLL